MSHDAKFREDRSNRLSATQRPGASCALKPIDYKIYGVTRTAARARVVSQQDWRNQQMTV